MACAGHTLPPSGCETLPGPTARPTEEHGTHLGSCGFTDSAADSTVPLGVAAGDTWDLPDTTPHVWNNGLAPCPLAQRSRDWG